MICLEQVCTKAQGGGSDLSLNERLKEIYYISSLLGLSLEDLMFW